MTLSRLSNGRLARVAAVAVSLLVTLLVASPANAATPSSGAASPLIEPAVSGRFLNLHQCVYFDSFLEDALTTVVADGSQFDAGTNVSNTADTSLRCGVDNAYRFNSGISGLGVYDLTAGRFLNLHQCVYFSSFLADSLTSVVADGSQFDAGTNVSNSADTSLRCGPGNSTWTFHSGLSGLTVYDLAAGRFLNLHQCVYFDSFLGDSLTSVVADGAQFDAGTNVSNTADTSLRCGPGNGTHILHNGLSGFVSTPASILVSSVALARNGDGRLQLFGASGSSRVGRLSQLSPNSSSWSSGWTMFDGLVETVAAERNADGRLELFGVNAAGGVYHRWQASPNSESWSPWVQFDGVMSSVAAARNADGRLELFATNAAGNVFHRWQTSPNSGSWSPWVQFDGLLTAVAAESNADGRLELFGVNAAGGVFHRWQSSPNSGSWSPWVQFDGRLSSVAAARNADGRLELFGANSAGAVFHRWQTSANGHTWSAWVQFDGLLTKVAAETNADGRLEFFGVNAVGNVYHRWQTSPNTSNWSPWVQLNVTLAN